MYKLYLLLVAVFLGCALTVEAQSPVRLHVFSSSSVWWLAVQPRNDGGQTAKVELKDAAMSAFVTMTPNEGWGYYALSSASGSGFTAPLTFRLTSKSGATVTIQMPRITPDSLVDSGSSYAGAAAPSAKPSTPTSAPPTTRPTSPTSAPTTKPATATSAPTSKAATPTSAPTTKPATTAPPTNNDLCAIVPTKQEPIKLMVPLYVYPGAAWDNVVAAASKVGILAIINPNSGPLPTMDSAYSTYMTKLKNANVEMVGYVYTSYGNRDVNAVKADVDTYFSKYPNLAGIFLDEAANEASKIPFYTQIYNHIKSKSGYKHVILNPGVQPAQGYLDISTNIMIYENYATSLAGTSFSSWVKCAPSAAQKAGYQYKFSGVVHTATVANQAAYINTLHNMGIGYVYVTDGAGGCCTYNSLVSYLAQEASSIQSLNS